MRNDMSHFGTNPYINRPRSVFNMPHSHKTTMNVGELVPIDYIECYPGDSHTMDTSFVARLQTLLTPVMDNMYLQTFWFFVPFRLLHDHFVNIMGENTQSAWIPAQQYSTPQVTAPSGGWDECTIADYFGIPTKVENISISSYYFKAYAKCVEDWFRDQNVQDPVNITTGDSDLAGSNGSNYITDLEKGGKPFIVSRKRDLFSTCLPSPQKGDPVMINLAGSAPVFGNGTALGLVGSTSSPTSTTMGLQASSLLSYGEDYQSWLVGRTGAYGAAVGSSQTSAVKNSVSDMAVGVVSKAQAGDHPERSGLIADMSAVTGISVNTLRLAFQMQKILEADARGGSRYISLLLNHFSVHSGDARLQRSEYLGGTSVPINVNQVVQTSESSTTPQGNLTAYSHTSDQHKDFSTYSCTEHGVIIGLACVRYDHSYQQGIDPCFLRKTRYDWYWPEFSNIGETAILNKNIYAQGSSVVDADGNIIDDQVFGYNEAWADLRTRLNRISGEMRSNASLSLDSWHLADDYASLPYLSSGWMQEDKTNVDRVLAVTSEVSNQVFVDFYFQQRSIRPLPVYSIPGLIDHM